MSLITTGGPVLLVGRGASCGSFSGRTPSSTGTGIPFGSGAEAASGRQAGNRLDGLQGPGERRLGCGLWDENLRRANRRLPAVRRASQKGLRTPSLTAKKSPMPRPRAAERQRGGGILQYVAPIQYRGAFLWAAVVGALFAVLLPWENSPTGPSRFGVFGDGPFGRRGSPFGPRLACRSCRATIPLR